jgi:hypothetical protein
VNRGDQFACELRAKIKESEKQILLSACCLRTPSVLRQSPINPFPQISELRPVA